MFPINPDLSMDMRTFGAIFVLCLVSSSNLYSSSTQKTGIHTNRDSHTHTSDILIIDRSTQSSRQSPITRKIIWVSTSISGLGNRISPSQSLFSFSLRLYPSLLSQACRKDNGLFHSEDMFKKTAHCPQEQAPNQGHQDHL